MRQPGHDPTDAAGPQLVPVPLGATGLRVTPLVFGTAPLSSIFWGNNAEQAIDAVVRAVKAGITTFDTAPLYGLGEAEERLGRGLSRVAGFNGGPGGNLVLTTKVGRSIITSASGDRDVEFDFSHDATMRQLDASLSRLNRDHVDIVHVHDPEEHLGEALDGCFAALTELRADGRITAISVGTNHCATAIHFLDHADPDVVMVAGRLTLLDRSALDELVPACQRRGTPLLAAAVFNSGALARPGRDAWYDYAPAGPEILDRVEAMRSTCREFDVPLKAAALQFPLRASTTVAAVVVGMATAEQVAENVGLFQRRIPDELWDRLAQNF